MRPQVVALAAIVLLTFVRATSAVAQNVDPSSRIRTTSELLASSIREGAARSPTFAHVVADLELSDVVAYVEFDDRLPSNLVGRTRLSAVAGGVRHIRIGIRRRLSGRQQIVMVARELQVRTRNEDGAHTVHRTD